jgi:hypothetical protein
MRAAVVRLSDNVVENIIVANAAVDSPPGNGRILVNADSVVQIGWTYIAGAFVVPPAPPAEPTPVRVPGSVTRRQCALQLLSMGTVTPQEALDMVKTAAVPAAVSAVFAANFNAEQRILAEIDFAADNYYRSNSLLGLMGLTGAQIDEFFIAAAQK